MWDARVLNFTKQQNSTENQTIEEIKAANTGLGIEKEKNAIWYTLIALKLLRDEFADDAKYYQVVEKKAREAL
jgi:hypothetical protein